MLTFTEFIPEDPEYGPPCPPACPDGWGSHTWTVEIECGSISIHTDECPICNRGISDLESEYFNASFPAKIEFRKETYGGYGGYDVDVWWDILPQPEVT